MEQTQPSPEALLAQLPSAPAHRHDGWSGEKMAKFCDVLAETAVVAEACEQCGMGISGAYALRRRNPLFAAAWEAALTIARERLADTLLARAIEGNIEQVWRNGEVVGERHVIDNRLGLAILRRLDRLAETGCAVSTIGTRSPAVSPGAAQPRSVRPANKEIDWEQMVDALRTQDPDAVAEALATLCPKMDEVEEVEDPPLSSAGGGSPKVVDVSGRCWESELDGTWMTDFPPPPGFTGYQSQPYEADDECAPYERWCTAEEVAAIEESIAAERRREREEEEQVRDAYFAMLRRDAHSDQEEEEETAADA